MILNCDCISFLPNLCLVLAIDGDAGCLSRRVRGLHARVPGRMDDLPDGDDGAGLGDLLFSLKATNVWLSIISVLLMLLLWRVW